MPVYRAGRKLVSVYSLALAWVLASLLRVVYIHSDGFTMACLSGSYQNPWHFASATLRNLLHQDFHCSEAHSPVK